MIQQLHDDCIGEVLSFLPLVDLFQSASLVCRNWLHFVEELSNSSERMNWLKHIRYFLQKTIDRYDSLHLKSKEWSTSRRGMSKIYKKRADRLREKLLTGLNDVTPCKKVLVGIIAHEWYYLFHSFCRRFRKIKSDLTSENVKQILIYRNVNYSPRFAFSVEACVRNFLENFVKLSQIHPKQVERVLVSERAEFYKDLLETVTFDTQCIEILMQNPKFPVNDSMLLKMNHEHVSCELFREMMKRIKLPVYSNLSKLFNERFDFFQIAIEEVSKRSPDGVYMLIYYSRRNFDRIFEIENPQLEEFITRYYTVDISSITNNNPSWDSRYYKSSESYIQKWLISFIKEHPYHITCIRNTIIKMIAAEDYCYLNQLVETLYEVRGSSKFRAEELRIDDNCVLSYIVDANNLDFSFLKSILKYTDYNCAGLLNKLQERAPAAMRRKGAEVDALIWLNNKQ